MNSNSELSPENAPAKKMWQPTRPSQMAEFMGSVNERYHLNLRTYADLYAWSITQTADFWENVASFCALPFKTPFHTVVDNADKMPGAKWFEGGRLNVAEAMMHYQDHQTALICLNETDAPRLVSYEELYQRVAAFTAELRAIGVKKGDRVAAIVTNGPGAIIGFLATASLGAIWSSCSPDFGVNGILDRLSQIEPKVLLSVSGYTYHGKIASLNEKLDEILEKMPSIEALYLIPNQTIDCPLKTTIPLHYLDLEQPLSEKKQTIQFEYTDFQDPLYIVYSSGTTGTPKAIVHSAGGSLIQHLKEHRLHCDLKREDTLFYFTTCGWMMWNWLVSGLATGASLVLFDGSPSYPEMISAWQLIDTYGITIFGTSAKFIASCGEKELKLNTVLKLDTLRTILSTGSPLLEEQFDYIYTDIKADVQVASISGGTDIVSCFALGNPLEPVYRGFLQCRGLGMAVDAVNEAGAPVINQTGELICRKAAPCMPIYFWNDEKGRQYHNSYFSKYDGIWYHGDFIYLHESGHLKVLGRSDATLNPGGVRIGTSEIYRVVEALDEVVDSVVIGKAVGADQVIVLFVQLADGYVLNKEIKTNILSSIKTKCSPRHVPRRVYQVSGIPYTMNGKKVELAVKQVVEGQIVQNKSALRNPEILIEFTI